MKKTRYQCANMYLNEEERLQEEVKEHVCDDLTDARERLCFTAGHLKSQVSYILQKRTKCYLYMCHAHQTATENIKLMLLLYTFRVSKQLNSLRVQ